MEEGVTGRIAAAGVGDRLAVARAERGLTLAEIAAATRIPQRHLETIEADGTEGLPALPYTLGFVRSYARMVGIDAEAAAQEYRARLNADPASRSIRPEPYEPADPARVPPKWLALIALIVAILIGAGYAILRGGETESARIAATTPDTPLPAPAAAPVTPPAPARPALVSLTATAPVWISVYEKDGPKLFEREMAIGQTFVVPAAAVDPRIRTSRPQALVVRVGDTPIATIGPADKLLVDRSLKPAALLGMPAADPSTGLPAAQPIAPLVPLVPPGTGERRTGP